MSFQQGLSGLNAASKYLDAIGNNVSNSSTVGFKGSTVQFDLVDGPKGKQAQNIRQADPVTQGA